MLHVIDLNKSFGKKDISKLHKKQVTDKTGKRTTVYVKNGEKAKRDKSSLKLKKKYTEISISDLINFAGGEDFLRNKFKTKRAYDKVWDYLHTQQDALIAKLHKDFEEVGQLSGEKIGDWIDNRIDEKLGWIPKTK